MGIRQVLNKHQGLVVVATVIIAGAALWYSISGTMTGVSTGNHFFSDDDGSSYFAGNPDNIPPYDANGKTVVRAIVVNCNGKKTVLYLERYKPAAKQALEESVMARKERRPPKDIGALMAANQSGVEVKKPGDKDWVDRSKFEAFRKITDLTCPDGSVAELLPAN